MSARQVEGESGPHASPKSPPGLRPRGQHVPVLQSPERWRSEQEAKRKLMADIG